MVGDLAVDVLVELLEVGDALLGGRIDLFDHVVHEAAEHVLVLGWETEHAGDHVDRDVLRVLHGGIDTDAPGVTGPMLSSSSSHSRRTSGSHGSIAFGENGGSSSRRAIWWNGGSLVIGGAGPTGAAMPGRALLTTTPLLVKWSVS